MIDLFTENDDAQSTHSFSETKSKASDLAIEDDTKEPLFTPLEPADSIFSGTDDLAWHARPERPWPEETDLFGQPKPPDSPNHETTASESLSRRWNPQFPSQTGGDSERVEAKRCEATDLSREGSEGRSQETLEKYIQKSPVARRSFGETGISMKNIHQLKRQYYSNFDYKAYIDDYLKNIGNGRVRSNRQTPRTWTVWPSGS